ncbi:MAG: YceI family protein [Saprospiraceae bacterium]|nr:YceI family protein [Saprospiraceae bacterium]MCB9325909.1 YceI family protein [Lewinellaceae bacterium]
MKGINLFIIALFFTISAGAQTTSWSFDKAHTNVRFSVDHMVISEVEGNFNQFDGTVWATKEDFSDLKAQFTIQTASVDTDQEKRDGHLKSADFFDVEKYPTITFKSKAVKKMGNNTFKLIGDFTMIGVTKEVELEVKHLGTIQDPWGNTKAGFKITGTLNRNDWGLKYNSVMDNGGMLIGEEVNITCNVELAKEKTNLLENKK